MSETTIVPVDEKTNRAKPKQPDHPNLLRGGPGRPKGVRNKAAQEVKEIAQKMTLGNPQYVSNLQRRLLSGKCNPAVEVAILHYGYGKPVDKVELSQHKPFVVLHRAHLPGQDPLALPEGEERGVEE